MLQAKTSDPETKALVDGATSGMLSTIDMEGVDAVEEWEVCLPYKHVYFIARGISKHWFRVVIGTF